MFYLKDKLFARNGSGTFSYTATSVAPAISDTAIESADFNTTLTEIADALTQSLSKDGQTVITGAMDFDGNELILDADGDSSVTADTPNRIDFRLGGTDIIRLNTVASAVNGIDLFGSATGNAVDVTAFGTDTNIDINLTPKGSGMTIIPGHIIQVVEATPYTTYSSHTTIIPYDDTIPQNTEGEEIITVSITPKSATNRLRIIMISDIAESSVNDGAFALFQDATANALAISPIQKNSDGSNPTILYYEMASGTTSSTTFKIRAGSAATGTLYINGDTAARKYGGISSVKLRVEEVAV